MSSGTRLLKVFLCHAHADRDTVGTLYTRLTKDGVDVWLDKEKLFPGQSWELEIRRAVREADVVIVCLSKQFNQAGFRQKEVRLALDTAMEKPEGEIFIIPARLEECDTLDSLRQWHWVNLFEDDGYTNLLRALQLRANSIGTNLQIENKLSSITSLLAQENKPNAQISKKPKVKIFFWTLIVFLFLGFSIAIPFIIPLPLVTINPTSTSPTNFTAVIKQPSYCYNGPSEAYLVSSVISINVRVDVLSITSEGEEWFLIQGDTVDRCWVKGDYLEHLEFNPELLLQLITVFTLEDTNCQSAPDPGSITQTVIPKDWRIVLYGRNDLKGTWLLVNPHDSTQQCWVDKDFLTAFNSVQLPVILAAEIVNTPTPTACWPPGVCK